MGGDMVILLSLTCIGLFILLVINDLIRIARYGHDRGEMGE